MFLSRSCTYGLRASLYLASLGPNGFVPIRTISRDLSLSSSYLTKIFQKMTRAGLMHSHRGPNGGVAFRRPAETIPLLDIVTAIDGTDVFPACALGLTECGPHHPCPLHPRWTLHCGALRKLFADATLADVSRKREGDPLAASRLGSSLLSRRDSSSIHKRTSS